MSVYVHMITNASSYLPGVCSDIHNSDPPALTVVLSIAFLCVLLIDSGVNAAALYQLVRS